MSDDPKHHWVSQYKCSSCLQVFDGEYCRRNRTEVIDNPYPPTSIMHQCNPSWIAPATFYAWKAMCETRQWVQP